MVKRGSRSGWYGLDKKEWESESTRIRVKRFFPSLISARSCSKADILPLNYLSLSANWLVSSR